MKRLKYSVAAALVAMTILAPGALAQEETTIIEETTVYPQGAPAAEDTGGPKSGDTSGTGDTAGGTEETMGGTAADTMSESSTGGEGSGADTTVGEDPLPTSGGPAIFAPAVALLLGSGILVFTALRRRR